MAGTQQLLSQNLGPSPGQACSHSLQTRLWAVCQVFELIKKVTAHVCTLILGLACTHTTSVLCALLYYGSQE